ncbi:MAG: SDR family oxidoreductase [Gammaproteobacteria bacterium]|nr:SDR family oxidoreductase [Gammaproteobacteria bacterium]
MQQLKDKRVLITGASSGIGRSLAIEFAREGAKLILHGRSEHSLAPVLEEIRKSGITPHGLYADLNEREAVVRLCQDASMKYEGIDIVINNAGAVSKAPISTTSEEEWDRILQVNLTTPYLISHHLVPVIKKNEEGGRLIFISSVAAKLPDPFGSAYNASKAGLLGLVRCLAAELGRNNITVNAICPGWVDTGMAERLHTEMPSAKEKQFDEFYDASIRANMLNARITPDNIAEFAVYLASEKGKFMTAQSINVCAGLCPS